MSFHGMVNDLMGRNIGIEAKELRRKFRIFTDGDGKDVLAELFQRYYGGEKSAEAYQSAVVRENPNALYFAEGQRNVVRFIMQMTRQSEIERQAEQEKKNARK